MPSGKEKKRSNRIVLNVGGVRHETFLSTLKTIPDTRLSYLGEHHTTVARSPEYDASKGEYFFDRHPGVFAQILNFYRTGRLHCPSDVCGPLFEEELGFWGIDEEQVETCCWENYKQHKEKQEKLKYFKLPGFEEELSNDFQSKDSGLFEDVDDGPSWWSRYQPKVWKSLEEPYTSFWAKLVGIVSFVVFTAYIIKFALSTLDYFSDKTAPRYIALSVIHLICISWFTMDFALRLLFSPDKRAFLKSPYTWMDLIPLVLLYVLFFHPSLEKIPFLEMLVMFKAARIFQLFKLSYVLQVLVNTLKASSSELCLLLVIMGFVMVVFASFVYFLERQQLDSDFKSVPDSMWWAVITMTTVGYGEVYPRTWIGKTVGSACAICGVLVIALPVSVVASNFSLFYTYAKARLNLPPKKRRVAFSHALTSMHNQRPQCENGDGAYGYNFASLCSERQTDRSYPASEVSISCTMTPRGSLKKSSFWSLRSMSKLLRPSKRSNVSRSKSLNSLSSDHNPQKEMSADKITLKFDPPSRLQSATDITRDQTQGSLTTGENTFLHVPRGKKGVSPTESLKETPKTPLPNRSLYPLHLRRGAVSPSSFSLRSASTASSLNALPRGYNELCNALSGKGPIILLSDQASMQSLCSINSRMTCSCSSLKSAGSDGTQGTPPNAAGIDGNRTNTGSDGSFENSPPSKFDWTQVTLSVPTECHGKRRETSGYDGLSAVVSVKCRNDTAEKNIETKETLHTPIGSQLANESGGIQLNKSDADITGANNASSMVNQITGDTQRVFTPVNVNQNSSCKHCQEKSSSAFNFEHKQEMANSPQTFLQNDGDLHKPEMKLPVKPVPVIGRTLSAYSIMEYNLGKNSFPSDGQSQVGFKDLSETDKEEKAPKRRHSAFTVCPATPSIVIGNHGRLSTGYMKEHVPECEPLINGNAAQVCLDDVFVSDEEMENVVSDVTVQQRVDDKKRLRKSGVSFCYSPENDPPSKDIAVTESKNHANDNMNEETLLRPIRPCSSNGYLPSITVQCEDLPKLERTSRV